METINGDEVTVLDPKQRRHDESPSVIGKRLLSSIRTASATGDSATLLASIAEIAEVLQLLNQWIH